MSIPNTFKKIISPLQLFSYCILFLFCLVLQPTKNIVSAMTINLTEIKKGMDGLSPTVGAFLYEGCIVCLSRNNHNYLGTELKVDGDESKTFNLLWDNEFNDQLDRSWKDQDTATESGAYCIAILLALKLTGLKVIEQSPRNNGFDYFLGKDAPESDAVYQNTVRLEVSGIFNNRGAINGRYDGKVVRLKKYQSNLPAYIGIIEFGTPQAKFGSI